MYCRKCGTQISDDSIFCYKCGEKVIILNSNELNNNTNINNSIENNENSIDTSENSIDTSENSSVENDKSNIDTDIKSDTKTKNITETGSIEKNTEIINIPKTSDIAKQNTYQQNYNSANIKPPLQQNKGADINRLLLIGAIFLTVSIIFATLTIIMYTSVVDSINNPQQQTKTFYDEKTGISFTYPKTWKNSRIDSNKGDIVFLKASTNINRYPRMSVTKLDMKADKNTLNNLKYSLSNESNNNGNEVEQVFDTKVDGKSAIKLLYAEKNNIISIQYIYVYNSDIYLVMFNSQANTFDRYEPVFDSIMESYTIIYNH